MSGSIRSLRFSFFNLFAFLIIILCFGFSSAHCLETGTNSGKDSTESPTDYPQKIPSRTTWEKIVSFPGAVIFVPFKIIYMTSKIAFDIDYEVPYFSKIADLMVSNDGRRSLLPTYGSRRGGGLKYKHKGLISERSVFDITSTIWMRNRSMQRIRFRDLDLHGGVVTAGFNAEYFLLPDERFYGIGMDSEKNGKTNFAWEKISFNFSIGKRFFERLNFKGVFAYQRNNILPGRDNTIPSTTDIYDDISLPGLETGIELTGGNLGIEFDSRNHPGRPTAGWELSLGAGLLQQSGGDRFGFWESSFDIKRYVHLFYHRYMVFRIAARSAKPLPNK
ncbi:MAG: BamA/TamA family outer membrane protein [Candidatus Zixiibacteriota bacterium]|nr:MAG: BamA/TamA family outer membrane protein [candidate division Zixibacteria bacterium]